MWFYAGGLRGFRSPGLYKILSSRADRGKRPSADLYVAMLRAGTGQAFGLKCG